MNMLLWSTDVTGPQYLPVFELLRGAGYEGVEGPIFGGADIGALERLGAHLHALGVVPLGVPATSAENSPISADPAVPPRAPAPPEGPAQGRGAPRPGGA